MQRLVEITCWFSVPSASAAVGRDNVALDDFQRVVGYALMILSGERRALVECEGGQNIEFFVADEKAEDLPLTALCVSVVPTADRSADLKMTTLDPIISLQDKHATVLQFSILDEEIRFRIGYIPDVVSEFRATRVASLISVVQQQFSAAPQLPMRAYTLLANEDAQLVTAWRGPRQDNLLMHTLPELIERQCLDRPSSLAIRSGSHSLSYADLRSRSSVLARRLYGLGVTRGMTVAVYLPRSIELYVALLAVLRIGAVIAPLDLETPKGRLGATLARLDPALVVTTKRVRHTLPLGHSLLVIDGLDASPPGSEMVTPVQSGLEDKACILFTSGSTGVPKGVVTGHAALSNRICWMQQAFDVSPSDVVLQKTPLSFDVFLWEVFLPLACGACLAVPETGAHRDAETIRKAAVAFDVTIMHFVPSMLRLFLNEPTVGTLPSLRHLICSGEALSRKLSDAAAETLGIRPANLYGPTEAAIDVTWWPADNEIESQDCPIGFPISNLEISIRDRFLRRLPIGAPGEICISGAGLADGYLNDASLTDEKFVTVSDQLGAARLYRTGDLGRHLESGALMWLGRQDSQIKIGGVRVELAEVESHLASCPGVLDAVAQVTGGDEHQTVVCWALLEWSGVTSEATLIAALAQLLPSPALPARIHLCDRFPINANGKVDRRKLLENLGRREINAPSDLVAVAGIRARVKALAMEVLFSSDLDEEMSFFEQGGTSLRAVLLVSRIRAELGVDLSVSDFFLCRRFSDVLDCADSRPQLEAPTSAQATGSYQKSTLSNIQRRLWLSQMRDIESRRYNLCFALEMPAQHRDRLNSAVTNILKEEQLLRSHIVEQAGVPTLQPMMPDRALLDEIDLAAHRHVLPVEAAFNGALGAPFRLDVEPAARLALATRADRLFFLLCVHHVVFDEQSWNLMVGTICASLDGILPVRKPSSSPPLQRTLPLREPNTCESRAFWAAQLASPTDAIATSPAPSELDSPRSAICRHTFRLDANTARDIQGFNRASGLSPSVFFLASFGLFLCDWADIDGATICVTASTRTPQDVDRIGFFVNLLPIIIRPDWRRSAADFIAQVSRHLGEALDHRFLPFDEIVAGSPGRFGHSQGLDEICFVYREQSPNIAAMRRLDIEEILIDEREARFLLKLDVMEVEEGYRCYLIGDQVHFTGTVLAQMADRLTEIFASLSKRTNMSLNTVI